MILKINYSEGSEVETAWSFSSLEAKDGMNYRFNVHHSRDGATVEVLGGEAGKDFESGKVFAEFFSPVGTKIKLPKGTMFPTRHLAGILEAAENKQFTFSKVVFDGASLENPYQINALITSSKENNAKTKSVQHVRMAFFPTKAKEEQPQFELGINYRPDGIAERIKQVFGTFSLDLKLNTIELLKKPDC